MLTSAPGASTCATSVSVATAGAASEPTVHTLPSYVPCDGVGVISVRPAGSASVITTPVAGLGPRLIARTVKVTVSPTSTSLRSTFLTTSTSAAGAVLVIVPPESLFVFGSGSFWPVFTATFVIAPGLVAVAVITSCAWPSRASAPTVHTPVPAS